jgi:hypothetical protein
MDCVYSYKEINTKDIIFGRNQNYDLRDNNTIFIPIYYKNNRKKQSLIIKTSRLFIKNNSYKYNNTKKNIYFYDVFLKKQYDNDDDDDKLFSDLIKDIQNKVKRIIKKRKYLDISNKNFVPIIKKSFDESNKIILQINDNITKFVNTDNKCINDIKTPTYAYFIIHIKSIWINSDKWGININTLGCLYLPSQIDNNKNNIDINLSFKNEINEINNDKEKEAKSKINLCDHEIYGKFFKMKKIGIPIFVIEQKIKIHGLDLEEFKNLQESNNLNNSDVKTNRMKISPLFLNEIKNKTLKKIDTNVIEKKKKEPDNRIPRLDQILLALNKMKNVVL